MAITDTIEALQKDVTQITTELAETKKLEDEALKKTKAEAAELKAEALLGQVTTAKEEANKQLEALKGKTDATSVAEISKLEEEIKKYEAMLVTLNTSKMELIDLKVGVDNFSNMAEKSNETIDNAEDIESIRAGIEEMKTMITELQDIIDEYNKDKKTMSETDKTTKETEITEKKKAIETKRKEIQAIIDKIKKKRADVKFDDIEEEDIKATLKKQKESEEATINSYQKSLDAVLIPATNFSEKINNTAKKTWGWVKENPWATAGIVAGGVLLVGWISGWFKKKKVVNENGEVVGKKRFRDKWYGKIVKYGLIGFGIRGIYKLLFGKKDQEDKDTGNGTEIAGTLRNIENATESFEKIVDPKTKENLNTVGIGVNTFFDGVYKFNDGTVPVDVNSAELGAADLDKYTGVIPHIIDNSYTDIGHFISESGLFRLSVDSSVDDITKIFGDMIAKGLEGLVGMILGTAGFTGTNVNMDKVKEFLAGKNSREQTISIYQMIYKTFTYANYVENAYMRKKIYDEVKKGSILYKRSDGDSDWEAVSVSADDLLDGEMMSKIELDPENYKIAETSVQEFKDDIREKKLKDIPDLGITQDDIEKFNKPLYDTLKEYNDERDLMQTEVLTSKDKTLDKMVDNIDDDLGKSFRESARKSLPLLNLFGGDADRAKKAFRETAGYNDLKTKYKDSFEKLKKESDTTKIKDEIDKYYCSLKEIATTQYAIEEAIDENGNIGVTIFTRFKTFFFGSVENIVLGFSQIVNADGVGDVLGGLFNIGTGAGSLWLVYYALRHPIKTGRFAFKTMGTVLDKSASLLGRHIAYRDVMPANWLKDYYLKNKKYLTYDYITGKISTTKANEVLKKMNRSNGDIFDFLKTEGVLGQTDPEGVTKFLRNNKSFLENEKIKKALFFKDKKWYDWLKNKKNVDIVMEGNIFDQLKIIRTNMDKLNTNQFKLCDKIIQESGIDDIDGFLTKMDEFTKSDALKNLDISKISTEEINDLAKKVGKDMKNLSNADEILAKINSLKVSTTSDAFDIIDPKIAKEKVAFDIYETRKTNLDNLTKEFDAGGKYEKYGPKYKSLYEDPHANLQVLDKQLADEMVDAKDPEVTKILDKIKTDQLKIFNKNIDDNITILTRTQGSLGTTAPDKIAKKTIQKQIDDLAVIKGMATKMNKQELEAFEGLMNIFKNKPHFQGDMISVREKAKSNETLMKALSEGDVDELKRLKGTGISEITDDMIKVFEDIKIKKVAKVLAASNVEDIIKPLLKAFARLT